MGYSQDTVARLRRELEFMAGMFPDVDVADLDRLNDLVLHNQVGVFFRQIFLSGIDSPSAHHLKILGDICLEFSYGNLAEALIRYCLDKGVIVDVEEQRDLVDTIIRTVTRFSLSEYIDVEHQSSQIRFFTQAGGFRLSLNRIPSYERLEILRLLRNSYVKRLLDTSLVEDPDLQALYVAKHNSLINLIRTINRDQLKEARWARPYTLENLEYGPTVSRALFKGLFDDHLLDPVMFDELLWKNFNIMLLPALGNISFEHDKITISNEGQGCIQDPSLEIWSDGKLVAEVSASGVVPAHKSRVFRLEQEDLRALGRLDPNRELTIHLVFSKFGHTPFRFVCTKRVWEVQESLSLSLDQQDIAELAKRIGVSPERIKTLAETRIADDRDLSGTVEKFIIEIRRLVEQDDGHVLLTSPGEDGGRIPRNETDVQIALKHWLRPMCGALNIDMNREPLTGRGQLDFKFSIGHDLKCLVEVKLFHSKKLDHGLEIQLPTYLTSEDARFGVYVPVIFEPSIYESKLAELKEKAHGLAQTHNLVISVVDIRAWKPDSASKALELEDSERYRL
jgi:hypothetical protein